MDRLRVWIVLLISVALSAGNEDAAPEISGVNEEVSLEIQTSSGTIVGMKEESTKGNTFYSYYSIPFAKPPVGDLRFKVIIGFLLFFC